MCKNICFINPQIYPDFIGGAEVFNYYLIKRLAKGNQVSYISLSDKIIAGATKYQLRSRRNSFQHLEIFLRIVKSKKDRIFVVSFMRTKWYYIIIYPLLNIIFNKKYVIIIHGGGMMPWKCKYPFILFFKKAKTIFGVSQVICQEYHKRTNIKIKYLPPLIPFEISVKQKPFLRKKYSLNEEAKVFLIVGSLKELKKPLIVLEALDKIDKAFLQKQKVYVLFAGDGPLKNKMEAFIKGKDLLEFVQLLGNVPRESINEYYKLSDYYIMSSDFEGTPIAMLEAMYNKLCIIGSNAQGINNLIKDSEGGFLFENNNALELSEIMIEVIKNNHTIKRDNAFKFFNKNFKYNILLNGFISNI